MNLLKQTTAHKMTNQIIVSARGLQATSPEYVDASHEWFVEGDYGFFGSFVTQNEAWRAAHDEANYINNAEGAGTVEVQLNA